MSPLTSLVPHFRRTELRYSLVMAVTVFFGVSLFPRQALAAPTITTVDGADIVGTETSAAIGNDGFPFVSYYDATNGDLKVVHCGNAACSSGNTLTTVDSSGVVGHYSSVAIGSDGFPVISYYDSTNGDLKVVHCGNAACSSGNTVTTVDSTGDVGVYTSIAIGADNNPVIASYDNTNFDLRFTQCGNASCSSGNTTNTLDSTGTVGVMPAVTIGSDDLPVIAYEDYSNRDLKVVHCGNNSCSSGNTTTTVDSSGQVGEWSSIAIGTNGFPIISYEDFTNTNLKVVKCGNAACSSGNALTTVDSTGDVGSFTSIALGSDGFPVISYYDGTNSSLKVAHCGDASCASGNTLTTVESSGLVGRYTSLEIGTNGFPVISYNDQTNADLKVAACDNYYCDLTGPPAENVPFFSDLSFALCLIGIGVFVQRQLRDLLPVAA